MKKSLPVLAILVIFAMVMAACGATNNGNTNTSGATNAPSTEAPATETPAQTEITVTHLSGETVVPVNPSKVVVFDYSTLDTLDKLGVEVASVPQSILPGYLEKYKDTKYANAGGLKEPDFEKINELAPDLIIISGRQADSYDELSKIAPTINLGIDNKDFMNSFKANAKLLGQIFGKEKEVEAELASIETSVSALHDRATASGKNGLIILANEGAISAYGPSSRFGIIHDVFGVTPADAGIEVSTHGQSVTFEYVAEKNADYLFVVDRNSAVGSDAVSKATIENELVKNTNAFKEGNIVYLDPQYWYLSGGGLMSVSEMVKEIDAAIK